MPAGSGDRARTADLPPTMVGVAGHDVGDDATGREGEAGLHAQIREIPPPSHLTPRRSRTHPWSSPAREWFTYEVLEAHVKAQRALQNSCVRQHAVYQLQLGVSSCFRQANRTKKESCTQTISEDVLSPICKLLE